MIGSYYFEDLILKIFGYQFAFPYKSAMGNIARGLSAKKIGGRSARMRRIFTDLKKFYYSLNNIQLSVVFNYACK